MLIESLLSDFVFAKRFDAILPYFSYNRQNI